MPFVPDSAPTGGRFVPDEPEKPKKGAPAEDPMAWGRREALGGFFEPPMAMASGMAGKVLGDIGGLGAVGKEMIAPTPGGGDPAGFARDIQERMTYQPRTQAGASPYNPLNAIPMGLGKLFEMISGGAGRGTEWAGEKLGISPAVMGPVASGAREAVTQAPMFMGAGAPTAAAGTSAALRGGAERAMHSALKPGVKYAKKVDAGIDTLLDTDFGNIMPGINITPGGLEKMREKISGLNTNISNLINNSPATIDKAAVATRLYDAMDKVIKGTTPQKGLAKIQDIWQDFMQHPLFTGTDIPIKGAQEMKQRTYKELEGFYGQTLIPAEKEAQMALARGLKEEIAKAVPEVRALNAEESKLLEALPMVERRVIVSANKNPLGLGVLTLLNPKELVVWMADRSELFKSLIARMLSGASRSVPGMNVAGPLLGTAATEQANAPPPGQPPPMQQ